jgi:hypothetical protein
LGNDRTDFRDTLLNSKSVKAGRCSGFFIGRSVPIRAGMSRRRGRPSGLLQELPYCGGGDDKGRMEERGLRSKVVNKSRVAASEACEGRQPTAHG